MILQHNEETYPLIKSALCTFERLSRGEVSLFNNMKRLSLGTLTAIRAKCDTGVRISHVSSLPGVNSAFCLSELVGPLQGDQEADAQ